MHTGEYRYLLNLYSTNGQPLGQAPLVSDWQPAREWAQFTALRTGRIPDLKAITALSVQPQWHATVGEPFLQGFQVQVNSGNGEGFTCDFPLSYWKEPAQQAANSLMQQGALKPGEYFLYEVAAYPVPAEAEDARRPRIESRPGTLQLRSEPLAPLLQASIAFGRSEGEDMPVLIPRQVFLETRELKAGAGANETGGILIGYLCRDEEHKLIYAKVTGQIPARCTQGSATRLTFTADTWTDVAAAIRLRGEGEIMLGWWHAHPARYWSEGEASEAVSPMHGKFFSNDDSLLHRAVFASAYMVGLVIYDTPAPDGAWAESWSLYGWRKGVIESRGFYSYQR